MRRRVTTTYNEMKLLLADPTVDMIKIECGLQKLNLIFEDLRKEETVFFDALIAEKVDDATMDRAYDHASQWHDKVTELRGIHAGLIRGANQAQTSPTSDPKTKLPKLKLVEFGGELKQWLSFWGSFSNVHDNTSLSKADKMAYLRMAMKNGTPPWTLVHSFPPAGDNYEDCVQQLTDRFGDTDLLTEVYVHEMMGLITNKSTANNKKLGYLHDTIRGHLRALESLGVTSNNYAALLLPMIESCLPEDALVEWQRNRRSLLAKTSSTTKITSDRRLTELMNFLKNEALDEARIQIVKESCKNNQDKRSIPRDPKSKLATASGLFSGKQRGSRIECLFCGEEHPSSNCSKAQTWSLKKRQELVQKSNCCFKCLKKGHRSNECRSKLTCSECGYNHLMILCRGGNKTPQNHPGISPASRSASPCRSITGAAKEEDPIPESTGSLTSHGETEVLLQTVLVNLIANGKAKSARALIDSGSQRSYITEHAVNVMGYQPIGTEELAHCLFGGSKTKSYPHRKFNVQLTSLLGTFKGTFELLEQNVICNKIERVHDQHLLKSLANKGIYLSDHGKDIPEVNILFGADILARIVIGPTKAIGSALATSTVFGWTICGKIESEEDRKSSSEFVITMVNKNDVLKDIWRLETLGIMDPSVTKNNDELAKAAMDHFDETVKVLDDGRYEIALPFIENHDDLPSYENVTLKRTENMINKLSSKKMKDSYDQVFKEWLKEGIIEEVPEEQIEASSHYLPHRPVLKEDSTTTKIRPVFDASNRIKGKPSINMCLEKGLNLVEQLPVILTRFRQGKVGAVADIKKAFLMISVREEDRNFLRFFWFKDDPERLVPYRHCRVVFGITSSPFLLGACIQHHLKSWNLKESKACSKLMNSFYVDNLLVSFNSRKECAEFVNTANRVMNQAKFELRCWQFSHEAKDGEHPMVGLLGMKWDRVKDSLLLDMKRLPEIKNTVVTKRIILSTFQQVFDPLGFVSPATLVPKLLMQEAWKLNITWDRELPDNISKLFIEWVTGLNSLRCISLPRNIAGTSSFLIENSSLHVFCDASSKAYASCIYLLTERKRSNHIELVMAKSRVAPIKPISLPRLELMACLIGVRLFNLVKQSFDPNRRIPVTFWSDSMNAICWIKRDENWNVFVRNRVNEILQSSSKEQWKHVPGKMNPADLPSRGCLPGHLSMSDLFYQPLWLVSKANWPDEEAEIDEEVVHQERMKSVISHLSQRTTQERSSWFDNFQSFKMAQIVTAWVIRFVQNCDNKLNRKFGPLSVRELEHSETTLIKISQREERSSMPKNIICYQDEHQIIRMKSKVFNRDDTACFRCPILISSSSKLSKLIVKNIHWMNSHVSGQTLISIIRENFWIPKIRKLAREVVHGCRVCQRFNARSVEVCEPPLPQNRVREAKAFEVVGVDLAGPLYLRGREKAWLVIFTCGIYRAVHLELVTSMSTEAFLGVFRRFISRRGRPKTVYSDNGLNFVGSASLLKEVDWKKVEKVSAIMKISWKFNPPSAAWWGGFWERLIRSVKDILKRVVGKACLNYEEMSTILCETENIINSRPLGSMGDDPNDLTALTPNMFIRDIEEFGTPDLDQLERSVKKLTQRAVYRQKLRDDLNKRFRSEYLGMLKNRKAKNRNQLKVGDIVFIEKENYKRLEWPLGRVLEVFPGKDGQVRVIKLKTSKENIIRPVQRLFPLEVDQGMDLPQESYEKINTSLEPGISSKIEFSNGDDQQSDHSRETAFDDIDRNKLTDKIITTKNGRKSNPVNDSIYNSIFG